MDIVKYIKGHCVEPHSVRIWDAYSQQFIVRELPCGKCLHCRMSHVNEWVTRLYAERKYSKYCYYVSLDYAPFALTNVNAKQLAAETAACYHNLNTYHRYGMHPLLLCKNHLQDYFKRLRKNTNIKFQYFACGEYGTHANGRGYARPHFHIIFFSNELIEKCEFEKAWTINGYKIGRVDFKDMNIIAPDSNSQLKVFKYVCKYLQKQDFDFEKLATIDFHRTYFKSMEYVYSKIDTLFPELVPVTDQRQIEFDWREYMRQYSPFIVCSKRPSIGSAYLAKNLERFKKQDFRLFGLPLDGLTFPRYYIKRTKDALFPFHALGGKSEKPSSSARLGNVFQILSFMYSSSLDFQNFSESPAINWRINYRKSEDGRNERYITYNKDYDILCRSLNFFDIRNKCLYQFDGYYYKVWAKLTNGTYSFLHNMSIIDVLREFTPLWSKFHKEWITPLYNQRVYNERELYDYINALFKPTLEKTSLDLFREQVYSIYQSEISKNYKTKLLMQNSKTTL